MGIYAGDLVASCELDPKSSLWCLDIDPPTAATGVVVRVWTREEKITRFGRYSRASRNIMQGASRNIMQDHIMIVKWVEVMWSDGTLLKHPVEMVKKLRNNLPG